MRFMIVGVFVIAAAMQAQTPSSQPKTEDPLVVAQRAEKAYAAGQFSEAATDFATAVAALPRVPELRLAYAKALAKQAKHDAALRELEVAASFGTHFDEKDAAWQAFADDDRFRWIVARMRARTAPVLRSETAFLLEKDLIPENLAFDPKSGNFYVGSMYKSKIIEVTPAGKVRDFVAPRRDGLWGVLGMKIDPVRRELWANSCNIDRPPMMTPDAQTAGQAAIFRFDLATGKLIRKYAAAKGSARQPFCFNDLVLASNGDVYATSGGDGIHRVRKDATSVETFIEPDGAWYNGIAISPDGRSLFVASHFDGVVRVDLATRTKTLLDLPAGLTLGAIDGLYFHDASLIAVQGTNPDRVIRAWLHPSHTRVTRSAVLEQAHPLYDHPLTGVIAHNHLYYIARSQLRAFENGQIWPMDRLKDTVILKLPLEVPDCRSDG